MALRRHMFFVSEDETVRRFPTARYDRLRTDRSLQLPEYANQRLRIAEVMVERADRSPIRLQIHTTLLLSFDALPEVEGYLGHMRKGDTADWKVDFPVGNSRSQPV